MGALKTLFGWLLIFDAVLGLLHPQMWASVHRSLATPFGRRTTSYVANVTDATVDYGDWEPAGQKAIYLLQALAGFLLTQRK